MPSRDIFDNISPLDFRYWNEEVAQYLSENAFTRYKLRVEEALVRILEGRGLCSHAVAVEIECACCAMVTTEEVYEEEKRIGHDIRALVNCIKKYVSDEAKPWVHKGKTYTISWRASAPKTVSVRLIKSGNLVRVIAQSVPPQTSSYAWTIPADLPEGRDYKIKIVSSESTASGESNAPFVITAAPASPTTAPVVQPGTVKPPVPTIQQQLPPGSGFPKKKEESKAPAGAPQTVPGKK